MSGSGGGGGGGVTPTTDCASLVIKTALNSPDTDILPTLKVKDPLDVRLRGAEQSSVGAFKGERLAGTITYAGVGRLVSCLKEGNSYVAIVQSIDGGDCRVEIRPRLA